MAGVIDMVGRKVGQWQVLRQVASKKSGKNTYARFRCQCRCGKVQDIFGHRLRRTLKGKDRNAPKCCYACNLRLLTISRMANRLRRLNTLAEMAKVRFQEFMRRKR